MTKITEQEVHFIVRGTPAPGGSKTAYLNKSTAPGARQINVTEAGGKRTRLWRKFVSDEARKYMGGRPWEMYPKGMPLYLNIVFFMQRPKAHFKANGELRPERHNGEIHCKMPDLTKLVRSTEDALTGICWQDDAQICMQEFTKMYQTWSEEGLGATGAIVRISPYELVMKRCFDVSEEKQ